MGVVNGLHVNVSRAATCISVEGLGYGGVIRHSISVSATHDDQSGVLEKTERHRLQRLPAQRLDDDVWHTVSTCWIACQSRVVVGAMAKR